MKSGSLHYVQFTCSYRDDRGRCFIRVFNFALRATWSYSEIIKNVDLETLVSLQIKQKATQITQGTTAVKLKNEWIQEIAQIVRNYREIMLSGGQELLVLPDSLKNLPLFTLSAMKFPAFCEEISDFSVANVHKLIGISVKSLFLLLYPRIYRIDNLLKQLHDPGSEENLCGLPDLTPASEAFIVENGAFLIDDGDILGVKIGEKVPISFLNEAFEVESGQEIESFSVLPRVNSALNERLNRVISTILGKNNGKYQPIRLLDAKHMCTYTIEDQSAAGPSYPEFLSSLHSSVLRLIGYNV